jgi:hypothetical protein
LTFHIKVHFYFEQAAHERWSTRELLRKNDTPLENLWDEICVQVQYRQSMFYDAYLDTITKTVSRELEGVAEHLRQAIWLQTDEGWDWGYDNKESEDDVPPFWDGHIADYILHGYVLREVADLASDEIDEYLDAYM